MYEKKIIVFSDTHKNISAIRKAAALQIVKQSDYVIHLGDYISDSTTLSKLLKREILTVKGNGDSAIKTPIDLETNISGKSILITHVHKYRVKWSLDRLIYHALSKDYDLVLFGHTHIPSVFYEGKTLFVNPGSLGVPISSPKYTFAEIIIKIGVITPIIHNL